MINILVLEDDADLRLAVCRHLENRGYLPFGSADADDALDLMEDHHSEPDRAGIRIYRMDPVENRYGAEAQKVL